MSADLLTPLPLGSSELPNRVLKAPLTRCPAEEGHLPGPLMAEYYAQRAGAGLIIAEATMATEGHSAFWREPGIHLACRTTQPLRSCLSPCDAGC
jgi:N-ethylmaleimide reductase